MALLQFTSCLVLGIHEIGIKLLCRAMFRFADLGMSFSDIMLLSFLRVLVRSFPPIQVQHVGSKLSAIFIKTDCKNAWPLVNENALFAILMSLYMGLSL